MRASGAQDTHEGTWRSLFKLILGADKLLDDLPLTFTLSLMLFSAILILKYVLLLLFCDKRKHIALLALNMAHDLFFIPGIQGSEHMAVQFMLLGLSMLLFAPNRRSYKFSAWLFMGIACLLNPIPIGPVILLAMTHIPLIMSYWDRFKKYFLALALAAVFGVVVIQGLQFMYALKTRGASNHFNTGLTLFVRNLAFLNVSSIALLLVIYYLPKAWPDVLSEQTERMRVWILFVLGAAVAIALIGPLIHFELWENNARYQRYVYIAECTALVTMLPGLYRRWGSALGTVLLVLALVFMSGTFMNRIHPGQPHGWSLQLHRVQKFDTDKHFPKEGVQADASPYFEASSPQQVFGYFIREDYERGPLVLNLASENYKIEKVIGSPSPPLPSPVDIPNPTP